MFDNLTACLQNVFTNHIFNIYVKIGFGIKQPAMVDMP